ncbi:MAG: hypothetical protein Q8O38_11840 [Sulfurimicrobium sp.]|nr:hypothetical protein [Sulfurimicrobium sp.]
MTKKKSFYASDQFAKVLAEGVSQAKQRMESDPSESHRREFVRATCSAIEAQSWQLKMYVMEKVLTKKTASVHDISALKEESYAINDKGEIYVQPRGYSLKVGLRLVYSILMRHGVPVRIDFGSADRKNIDDTVKIRNRVMHPKCMGDISVSESDAECCYNAFLFVHNMLLTTILGSALASLNQIPTGGGKSEFFSSAK